MIAGWKRGSVAAVLGLAVLLALAGASSASSADPLSFPPTRFAIVNPDTGAAIGRSSYRIDSAGDSALLRGENAYFDGQTDLETTRIRLGSATTPPKLAEFDHTFYQTDGSIMMRAHLDAASGAATCIDNSGPHSSTQSGVLGVPGDTWAGASVAIPIQGLLRAGVRGTSRPLHVFSCAPGPKIVAISVQVDPGNAVWTTYGAEALRVEVRPDLGWLNFVVASFVPKLHAWFDPNDGFAFVGDEAARYYRGPRIMLVKTRGPARSSAPTASAN